MPVPAARLKKLILGAAFAASLGACLASQTHSKSHRQFLAKTSGPATLAISPDGKWLALGNEPENRLLELESGETRPLPAANSWTFSRDGHWLLGRQIRRTCYDNDREQLLVLDAATLHVVRDLEIKVPNGSQPGFEFDCGAAVLLPGGTLRLLAKDRIQDWPLGTTKPAREVVLRSPVPFERLSTCAFSPDGAQLLAGFGCEDRIPVAHIPILFDTFTGKPIRVLPHAPEWIRNVSWSADARLAAVTDDDGAGTSVREAASGRQLWALPSKDVAFSPDSKVLVTQDNTGPNYALTLREASTGRLLRKLDFTPDESPGRFILTPDGESLLMSDHGGGVYRLHLN